jgi:hypothetical protein
MATRDARRVVGGFVWAKADAVSRDAKRIYGRELPNTWLRGTVMEVVSQKKTPAQKRATTYIRAHFRVGTETKVALIPLQSLKDSDPRVVPPPPPDENQNNGNDNGDAVPDPPAPVEAPEEAIEQQPAAPVLPPPIDPAPAGANPPASVNNGIEWHRGITDVDVNGPVQMWPWKFVCQYTGEAFTPGCDNAVNTDFTPYDFFMAVFPRKQLKDMVRNTSANLKAQGKPEITTGELLKWFGITILITRYEFGDRASLWSTEPPNKYIPAPSIGTRTGMSRNRYDTILKGLVWSFQPTARPEGMSSEEHRWMLVADFVNNLNDHKRNYFTPSTLICVDESMSRWYGLGGHWINMGLPMYVAMDRKPEDGCEIQNSCCGKSGILLQLKLVKSAAAELAAMTDDGGPLEPNGYGIIV